MNNVAGYIPNSIAPQFRQALLGSGSSYSNSATSNALVPYGNSTSSHTSQSRQVVTYTSRHRPGAASGPDGEPGRSAAGPSPRKGSDGGSGHASIFVHHQDGSASSPYWAKFEFQLVSFDVVDENDDGIFEPGECAIIKNIRLETMV